MQGHKKILNSISILFTLIQTILFTYSTTLIVTSLISYYRTKEILGTPFHHIVFLQFYLLKTLSTCIIGFKCISSKHNLTLFVYISLILFLVNVQFMGNIFMLKWVEKINEWGNKRWDLLNIYQIDFVEETLGCCGYMNSSDRYGSRCYGNKEGRADGCAKIVIGLGKGLVNVGVKISTAVCIIQSVSICLLLIMKIHKNEKEKP